MAEMHDRSWLDEQIRNYEGSLPRFRALADLVRAALEGAARRLAPLAIVQTRVKAIASLAEKIQRKPRFEGDVTVRFTDLCGGRIMAPTRSEVRSLCEFIEDAFEIDWKNSVDVRQRLRPAEFGYRSVHYVVSLPRDAAAARRLGVAVPPELLGLKAEIQVRTFPEHAWADLAHDLSYKGAFRLPERWQRELAALAAMLEQADELMERVEGGLREYFSSYDAYLGPEELAQERRRLEVVLEHDPDNVALACRIAKLAMCAGDWSAGVDVLAPHAGSDQPAALRDLGVALCKVHGEDRSGPGYRRGQALLQRACEVSPRDVDALSSLAGTFKASDPDRAIELYRRAFELDPSNPYPLGNLLLLQIAADRSLACLTTARPTIAAATARCRRQAEVGTNLPWARHDEALLLLLSGKPHESLAAYAKAVSLASASWVFETTARSLEVLEPVGDRLEGYAWARGLVRLGLALALGGEGRPAGSELRGLGTPEGGRIQGPALIVAGGTSDAFQAQAERLGGMLAGALAHFRGTVVSGGTRAGMSGIAGGAAAGRVVALGYLPRSRAPAGQAGRAPGYAELRFTDGADFSPAEPIRYWADLLGSGIHPAEVALLGAGGGRVSAAEYRIALGLGARVGLLDGTGGEAERLLEDPDWRSSPNLTRLPLEAPAVRRFLEGRDDGARPGAGVT